MNRVRHLLEIKGHTVHAIEPEAPVLDAIRSMAEQRIGALLVMRDGKLLGIVSERDYARKVILQGRASASTPVAEIMSAAPVTVDPDTAHWAQVALQRMLDITEAAAKD